MIIHLLAALLMPMQPEFAEDLGRMRWQTLCKLLVNFGGGFDLMQ